MIIEALVPKQTGIDTMNLMPICPEQISLIGSAAVRLERMQAEQLAKWDADSPNIVRGDE